MKKHLLRYAVGGGYAVFLGFLAYCFLKFPSYVSPFEHEPVMQAALAAFFAAVTLAFWFMSPRWFAWTVLASVFITFAWLLAGPTTIKDAAGHEHAFHLLTKFGWGMFLAATCGSWAANRILFHGGPDFTRTTPRAQPPGH